MDELKPNEASKHKQGGDRTNMLKLLDLVEELAGEPGNQWFAGEIQTRFKKSTSEGDAHQIIDVYEEYAKKLFKVRAENFYKDFKILELKNQLIEDYIRMEVFRNNGNFEDFCLAAFQQVENIVNTLIEKEYLKTYLDENIMSSAILFVDKSTGKTFKPDKITTTLGELLFSKELATELAPILEKRRTEWFFNYKLKAVLYYFYFKNELKYNTSTFYLVFNIGNELYQSRNLNHRGGTKNDYQEDIIEKVLANKQYYYLIFSGFIGDFTMTINKNL